MQTTGNPAKRPSSGGLEHTLRLRIAAWVGSGQAVKPSPPPMFEGMAPGLRAYRSRRARWDEPPGKTP